MLVRSELLQRGTVTDPSAALARFDFTGTTTNITKTLPGPVALLAVADFDTANRLFATATTKGAGNNPLASAFGAQKSIWHQLPPPSYTRENSLFDEL